MAIALEDQAQVTALASDSSVVLTPAGGAASSGEVVLMGINWIANTPGDFPSGYSASGFTQIANERVGDSSDLVVFRKVCGGSEPSTYSITWTGGTHYRSSGALIVLSGVDNTTPNGTAVSADDNTSDTTWAIPALTTTAANSWDVAFVAGDGHTDQSAFGSSTIFDSWGSSLVERCDIGRDYSSIGVATALRASAGTQAATSVTVLNAGASVAARVEIFETAGAAAVVAQSHFRWRDDNGSETAASWLDSEDASITRALSTNTRLRMQVNTTNDLASSQFQLEYKLSTDATYAKVQVPDATAAAFGAIGTATITGTTAPTVAYPTGITAGQLLVMVVGTGSDTATVSTPAGWTAPTNSTTNGGAGSFAAGTGQRRIAVFTKVADGTESGSVTLAVATVTNQMAGAAIFRCTKSPSKDWSVACAIGSDSSAGAAVSVAFGTDPGVTAGDLVFVGFMSSEDTATHASQALTQSGMTYGTMTERLEAGIGTGSDGLLLITQHAVTSGTSAGVGTWVSTASGTNAANTAGPAVMIRVRAQDQAMLMATSANVTASGETTTAQLTAPAGKSTSDFDAGRLQDDENPADAIDIDADDYTEVEWCIQASAVAAAGTYQFRVTRTGTVLDTYTVTPTWTIGAAAVGQPTMKRGRGIPGMRLGGATFGQGF